MISEYFTEEDVIKIEFKKEFISLWDGWLGKDDFYKLDEVTESEWSRFNQLLKLVHKEYKIYGVNWTHRKAELINDIDGFLPGYEDSMNRGSVDFSQVIIPELNAVLTEEWDYTFILWYKDNEAKEKLEPLIKQVRLFNFSE